MQAQCCLLEIWYTPVCRARPHLEEAVLCQGHESNGDCGDEAASNGNEGANEHKHGQEPQARQLQGPNAHGCQGCVCCCYSGLQRAPALGEKDAKRCADGALMSPPLHPSWSIALSCCPKFQPIYHSHPLHIDFRG